MPAPTDFYTQFAVDLKALVISVTGLPPAQVITTQQMISRNLIQLITQSTPGNPQYNPAVAVQMPLAVIGIGDFRARTDLGIQNDLYNAPLTIWYLMPESDQAINNLTNQQIVNNVAYQIAYVIRNNNSGQPDGYESFLQWGADGDIDSSESEPLNKKLRADERISIISSSVTWTNSLIVGDTATVI